MASDFDEEERYACAALFTLALHQSQVGPPQTHKRYSSSKIRPLPIAMNTHKSSCQVDCGAAGADCPVTGAWGSAFISLVSNLTGLCHCGSLQPTTNLFLPDAELLLETKKHRTKLQNASMRTQTLQLRSGQRFGAGTVVGPPAYLSGYILL